MADDIIKPGQIKQFRGPFSVGHTINTSGKCHIGISIGEKDYMKLGSEDADSSFRFLINGQEIWMGRTYIYEMTEDISNVHISFIDGAPSSIIVDMIGDLN